MSVLHRSDGAIRRGPAGLTAAAVVVAASVGAVAGMAGAGGAGAAARGGGDAYRTYLALAEATPGSPAAFRLAETMSDPGGGC